jgi:hypothetical protein
MQPRGKTPRMYSQSTATNATTLHVQHSHMFVLRIIFLVLLALNQTITCHLLLVIYQLRSLNWKRNGVTRCIQLPSMSTSAVGRTTNSIHRGAKRGACKSTNLTFNLRRLLHYKDRFVFSQHSESKHYIREVYSEPWSLGVL